VSKEHLIFHSLAKEADDPRVVPPLREAIKELEADLIAKALKTTGGNKTGAASLLQIDFKTLQTKMKEHRIN
jgi:DNA-binding NtrC family response regulator